jgi:hypothetical protein
MLGVNPAQEQAALGNLAADCQDTKESNDVAEEPDQPQQPPPSWGQHRYFATNQKLFDTAGQEYAADSMVRFGLLGCCFGNPYSMNGLIVRTASDMP